jgi:hypothetical protein
MPVEMKLTAVLKPYFILTQSFPGTHAPINSQGPEWKILAVAVITQKKDIGESCAGKMIFVPAPGAVLCREEIVDAPLYGGGVVLPGGHQPE